MSQLLSDPEVVLILARLAKHTPGAEADVVAASDDINELFRRLGHEDIGELIAHAIGHEIIGEDLGRWLLGVAVWSGETNGAELQPTIEGWLEGAQDSMRIGLALAQVVFPFRDLAEMTRVLKRIISRYPQHAEGCRQLIERRRQQGV